MFRRKIEVARWTEAEPQRGWPQRGGATWPTDVEYKALRVAKHNLDAGLATGWCTCGDTNCGAHHADKEGWSAYCAFGELHSGINKWAGVRRAKNRYGYESIIYVSDCDPRGPRATLMRWDGVPLKAAIAEERRAPEIIGGDSYSQRIIAGGATIKVSRR